MGGKVLLKLLHNYVTYHYNEVISDCLNPRTMALIVTIYFSGNNSIGNFDIIFTGGQDLIYYLDGSLNQLRMITGNN